MMFADRINSSTAVRLGGLSLGTQFFSSSVTIGKVATLSFKHHLDRPLDANVLLSFVQFEREVLGERICRKVAASTRKGMWMGGRLPLGNRGQFGIGYNT